jgi:heptosyltransferase-3
LYVPKDAVRRVDKLHLPGRFIVVNCSSNSNEKAWPEAKWKELSETIIKDYGISVIEIGIRPLLSGINDPNYVDLCGKLSILESAEVIRRARLFIGIDSGPAHLANAVETAGVILLGSYLGFTSYMPFSGRYGKGERVAIVHNVGPAADIPFDKVFTAVKKTLNNTSTNSHIING